LITIKFIALRACEVKTATLLQPETV
jgi:hypothetical protein